MWTNNHFVQKFAVLGIAVLMIPIILIFDGLLAFNKIAHQNIYYVQKGLYKVSDCTFAGVGDNLLSVVEWSLRKVEEYEEMEKDEQESRDC